MRDNRELKRHKDEKLRVLLITIMAYFVFLVIKKMDIVTPYLGITMLILLYLYANYNLIYLYTFNISIAGSVLYVIFFSLLFFSIRKDEGREEIPKITKFVQIFLIFKIVFVLTMLIF